MVNVREAETGSQGCQGNAVEEGMFDMRLQEWMEAGLGLSEARGGPGNLDALS